MPPTRRALIEIPATTLSALDSVKCKQIAFTRVIGSLWHHLICTTKVPVPCSNASPRHHAVQEREVSVSKESSNGSKHS